MWILDDISMLRQLTPAIASEPAHLFAPGEATRVRRNVNGDTPLPPEVPHALNPADGAIIDYWLGAAPRGDVTLDVLDAAGRVVRHLSSAAKEPVPEAARPSTVNLWVAPPFRLPANVGANRTNWDLRRDPPPAFRHSFEINANPGLTPASPEGALVLPGRYTLRLTVDGKSSTQTVTVRNDPRSPATLAALRAQDSLLVKLSSGMRLSFDADTAGAALRKALVLAKSSIASSASSASDVATIDALVSALDSLTRESSPTSFRSLNGTFAQLLSAQDNGDMAPTPSMRAAFRSACRDLESASAQWTRRVWSRIRALNAALEPSGAPHISLPPEVGGASLRCVAE